MSEENDGVAPNQNVQGDSTSKFQDENSSESIIQSVHNMCQKLLEKQKTLEKSNMELVEKLRSAEEEIKKLSRKLEEDTVEKKLTEETTSSPENPVTSSDVKSSQTLPMTGKCFVLKTIFKHDRVMMETRANYGQQEENFGLKWQLCTWKDENDLALFLNCFNSLSDEKWLVSSDVLFKLISTNGTCYSELRTITHENTKHCAYGPVIEWDKMKKDFFEGYTLTYEVHVKINKMTGIYKNDLKSFGDEMKPFSDVVLIVNEKKFFVSKLYLSEHSPHFKSLFLRQLQQSRISEIELTGIDADDFQNYLEVLYGEHAIDEFTVEGILLVAGLYDTPMVIRKCEEFLLEKSKKTLQKKLEFSNRYHFEALTKKCLREIKTPTDLKFAIPGDIHDLDPSIMVALFKKSLNLH